MTNRTPGQAAHDAFHGIIAERDWQIPEETQQDWERAAQAGHVAIQTQGADGAGTKTAGQIARDAFYSGRSELRWEQLAEASVEDWERAASAVTALASPRADSAERTVGDWRKVMRDLISEHDKNVCLHEETHRGGAIWTICDQCGRKWADDEGGFQPYEEPAAVTAAWALLKCEDATPAPATQPGVPDNLREIVEEAVRDIELLDAANSTFVEVIRARGEILEPSSNLETQRAITGGACIGAVRSLHALIAAQPAEQSATPEGDPTLLYWIESNTDRLCNLYPDAAESIAEFRDELLGLMEGGPAGQAGDAGAEEPCAWAGGNDTCYCRTCGEEYRYGRENKPPCPRKPTPNSTRTEAAETEVGEKAERTVQQLEDAAVGGLFHCEADREEAVEIITEALWSSPLAARPEAPSDAGWRERAATEIDAIAHRWGAEGDADGRAYAKTVAAILRADRTAPPSDPAPSVQAEG